MLAVILSLRPYSDRAHIVHTYTRACGRMNYTVYGLGKKKSSALYAPLSLVEMEVSGQGKAMGSVREAHLAYVPQRIGTDMRRQTVALFIAEVLYRTLRHPMGDEGLFDLIAATVRLLDNTEQPENVHLAFLIRLAEQLGFAINEDEHPELVGQPNGRKGRQEQLRGLCRYFAQHIDGWQDPLSMDVLAEVLAFGK